MAPTVTHAIAFLGTIGLSLRTCPDPPDFMQIAERPGSGTLLSRYMPSSALDSQTRQTVGTSRLYGGCRLCLR